MDFELEPVIWDLLEEYLEYDGEKRYRGYYVDQCISEVIQICQDLYGHDLEMNEEDMEDAVHRVWKIFCQQNRIPENSYSTFMFSMKRYLSDAGYPTMEDYKADIQNKLHVVIGWTVG